MRYKVLKSSVIRFVNANFSTHFTGHKKVFHESANKIGRALLSVKTSILMLDRDCSQLSGFWSHIQDLNTKLDIHGSLWGA